MDMDQSRNRRRTSRFPFQQKVIYKVGTGKNVVQNAGETVNIGSRGVLFTSEQPLPLGTTVEIAIDWPVLLDDAVSLRLVINGLVVRSGPNETAVSTRRYVFRTRPSRRSLPLSA
jgi:hypothetical protein